jgi:hypothetical protein
MRTLKVHNDNIYIYYSSLVPYISPIKFPVFSLLQGMDHLWINILSRNVSKSWQGISWGRCHNHLDEGPDVKDFLSDEVWVSQNLRISFLSFPIQLVAFWLGNSTVLGHPLNISQFLGIPNIQQLRVVHEAHLKQPRTRIQLIMCRRKKELYDSMKGQKGHPGHLVTNWNPQTARTRGQTCQKCMSMCVDFVVGYAMLRINQASSVCTSILLARFGWYFEDMPRIKQIQTVSPVWLDRHRGLSVGEYAALTCAGVFDFETGLRLIKDSPWLGWTSGVRPCETWFHLWLFHDFRTSIVRSDRVI